MPVLAHPAGISDLTGLLGRLKVSGLIGLEVFYNHYTSKVINRLLAEADKHGLIPTGGSDFHGLEGESMATLPEIALSQESVERLFALAGKGLELEEFKSHIM